RPDSASHLENVRTRPTIEVDEVGDVRLLAITCSLNASEELGRSYVCLGRAHPRLILTPKSSPVVCVSGSHARDITARAEWLSPAAWGPLPWRGRAWWSCLAVSRTGPSCWPDCAPMTISPAAPRPTGVPTSDQSQAIAASFLSATPRMSPPLRTPANQTSLRSCRTA